MSKPKSKSAERAAAIARDPRWARVVARDRTADGAFWYSVATTRVYCRPSCASRGANPKNVRLHDTLKAAQATGFRPCKRCRPDGPSLGEENAETVVKACRHIEQSEEPPTLVELARSVGLSTSHFHRLFKAATGLTPKDYAAAHRDTRARAQLQKGNTVTDAIYGSGFNSSGRFYEKAAAMLGMTPTAYRAGGTNEELRFAVAQSQLGAILVASSRKGVAAILMGDDPEALVHDLQDRFPKARLIGADRAYESLVAKVVSFVERAGARLQSAARRARDRVSTARVASAAQDPGRPDGDLSSSLPSGSARPSQRGPSPAPARPIIWQWRSRATAWCARTARSPDMPGASSASAGSCRRRLRRDAGEPDRLGAPIRRIG